MTDRRPNFRSRQPRGWLRDLLAEHWLIATFAAALLGVTIGMWILWAVNAKAIAQYYSTESSLQGAANWNTAFGAYSALFAALGFAVVIVTLAVQMRALNQQRCELHRDRLDALFFRLIDMQREIRGKLRYHYSNELIAAPAKLDRGTKDPAIVEGKQAILHMVREIRFWCQALPAGPGGSLDRVAVLKIYDTFIHQRYESDLGPWFRTISMLLERIDGDRLLSASQKRDYVMILRETMESHELFVLGMRAGMQDAEALRGLFARYGFFCNYPAGLRHRILESQLPPAAFATH
ncbi:MAG: hypothetical protein IE933_03895 [Sphingomonadales bacterium]|nr:hypothetical protein [Sphingomonadales bacterium]MBD3772564.1 hypothetical protein [Paracoccaceae bacterium]